MTYSGVLYWPLSTLSAARLSAPFFVLILAFIFLRELATKAQLVFLAFTLTGAAIMILNSPYSESDAERVAELGSATYLAYIFLFGETFGAAVGQVLMRKLRDLSNMTVSCYTNISSFCVFLTWTLLDGQDLKAHQEFDGIDWVALVSCSVCVVFAQVFYFVAL